MKNEKSTVAKRVSFVIRNVGNCAVLPIPTTRQTGRCHLQMCTHFLFFFYFFYINETKIY